MVWRLDDYDGVNLLELTVGNARERRAVIVEGAVVATWARADR